MFVTKNRFYTELCKIADFMIDFGNGIIEIKETHADDIEEVKSRINYTLQKLINLTERVEALEAKKTVKKTTTKKTKGK